MNKLQNPTLVEVVWSDDKVSQNYIQRLNTFLNPYNKPNVTTAMWNKEILPGLDKVNIYNRFMIVFDYDEKGDYQKCFSYSSPKQKDTNADLTYYILPNKQKVILNCALDIPTKYLIKANFDEMIAKETNPDVKKNLMDNVRNLHLVRQHQNEILEQYEVIYRNIWTNPKFHQNNVQWAHDCMINDKKQHEFCKKELELIAQYRRH